MQVDQIVALRSEALQLNETLRLAQLDKAEGEAQLQILKDKIAAKNLEGERSALHCNLACLLLYTTGRRISAHTPECFTVHMAVPTMEAPALCVIRTFDKLECCQSLKQPCM